MSVFIFPQQWGRFVVESAFFDARLFFVCAFPALVCLVLK